MKLTEISHVMLIAINGGVAKAVGVNSAIAPHITKAEAYRIYGRSNIDRWLAERLISPFAPTGKSSKKLLDRNVLDRVAGTSNRITYLPVADRKL